MLIREANLADVASIAEVHIKAWQETYKQLMPADFLANISYERRKNQWIDILRNSSTENFTYVVEDYNKKIVGFASGGRERTGDGLRPTVGDRIYQGELYAVYILPDYQGQGLGKCLISQIATKLSQANINSMLVWVLAKNPSYQFYERLGGVYLREKLEEFGGVALVEVAYGWADITSAFRLIKSDVEHELSI
ncbi:GNAT family N-acetyltransferase [Nostoc sp. MS1]|uniref:GNAT family N-acetyltransferase n=1 Tax=Nostoc sp. MS1 TaxID=2764711 RepID=UPI001CC4D699|nr:GNAT family N-acetyltransferase [Nostoc sp. MS1]